MCYAVYYDPAACLGPDGKDVDPSATFLVPVQPGLDLVMSSSGSSGQHVGSRWSRTVPAAGSLNFGYNDQIGATRSWDDNTGSFVARFTVWRDCGGGRRVSLADVVSQARAAGLGERGVDEALASPCSVQKCTVTPLTVERSFSAYVDALPVARRVFTVQFTNVRYCYDGTKVWFVDNPQFRLYVDGGLSATLQGPARV